MNNQQITNDLIVHYLKQDRVIVIRHGTTWNALVELGFITSYVINGGPSNVDYAVMVKA